MIKVHITPSKSMLPAHGGVLEHMLQLYRQAERSQLVELVANPMVADVCHVESAYPIPRSRQGKVVYVCHGGFVPSPLPIVEHNLAAADRVVTVAEWLMPKFFPFHASKTTYIPNGVDLDDFQNLPPMPYGSRFVLYGKEYVYNMDAYVRAAMELHGVSFISTVWPVGRFVPSNARVVGLLAKKQIHSLLQKAGLLMLTGSEVCPTMLLEAWAAGTPVVAWDRDGSEELMRRQGDVVGGALYTDNPMNSIHYVLDNQERLGKEGRELVEAHYQWKDIWSKYEELYKSLL